MVIHFYGVRFACALPVIALLTTCARPTRIPQPGPAREEAAITFFDVGQGDGAMIRTAGGKAIVIDTGHNREFAAMLRREGVRRIALLIVSHPHMDHAGGLAAVVRDIPVDEAWYAGKYSGRMMDQLRRAGSVREVTAGEGKTLDGVRLTVLHPGAGPRRAQSPSEVNNGSLVVKVESSAASYLFPGDCELGCWEELFRKHRSELRSDVLKAAHHGSGNGTNSGVLGSVHPKVFVISCGRNNQYGHPNATVLKLVQSAGWHPQLLRTDESGTIRCVGVKCQ